MINTVQYVYTDTMYVYKDTIKISLAFFWGGQIVLGVDGTAGNS